MGAGSERYLVLVTGLPGTGKSTIAEVASSELGVAVLSHDWAMSGLRPFPEMQEALDRIEPSGHRSVGWSILGALARSQLRTGRSVVLDGVARAPEIAVCASVAREEGVRLVVIATSCSDPDVHRSRVEGRQRLIPNWYELEWAHVLSARGAWEAPSACDLALDAVVGLDENAGRVRELLGSL